jgi:DNA-binding winged helix-turn-helix (wHTH) protein
MQQGSLLIRMFFVIQTLPRQGFQLKSSFVDKKFLHTVELSVENLRKELLFK